MLYAGYCIVMRALISFREEEGWQYPTVSSGGRAVRRQSPPTAWDFVSGSLMALVVTPHRFTTFPRPDLSFVHVAKVQGGRLLMLLLNLGQKYGSRWRLNDLLEPGLA